MALALTEQGQHIVMLAARNGTAEERSFDEQSPYPIIRMSVPNNSRKSPVALLAGQTPTVW